VENKLKYLKRSYLTGFSIGALSGSGNLDKDTSTKSPGGCFCLITILPSSRPSRVLCIHLHVKGHRHFFLIKNIFGNRNGF